MEKLNLEPVLGLGKEVGNFALHSLEFALHQLRGGGWADLADQVKPASITIHSTDQ